ncbi:peptide-methionine (S)-S-oxide reductase MsrA [Sulfitobacter sp. D35]|uniref:peptide-methionine (S)-S-oxide reductase MsrA n=1 Tax=Sulfitobacter sp. D35 TaxID=3083252 RepID=UPI00296E38F0|nr:peptide-methionine (S)-S-oxide reductase MsrA [Sulfitobacter sp. D35]MDW4498060.1 peptide-methionine (S)-S-oxide reductase MsrA [Sulfitobacter sp. D35]
MPRHHHTLRTCALAAAIALGLIAQSRGAHAAETETLTVAGGCFWCVEADFEKVKGVKGAVSGFTGGTTANPTYKQVTGGSTGHYEAVQIRFDPSVVSREQLLHMFFRSIDPTDAGGQFCDRGDSYRTAVFADGAAQKQAAQAAKSQAQQALGQTVVTPVLDAGRFYPADAYHQDYYKGDKLILTRFGPKRQASAYKAYREACGRDTRVRQLWGSAAPFVGS